jgi:hypothetical protein
VRDLAQTLQSWCAPGSVMAMSFLSASSEATAEKLVAEYARTVNAAENVTARSTPRPVKGHLIRSR